MTLNCLLHAFIGLTLWLLHSANALSLTINPTSVPINSVNDYTWSISELIAPATIVILTLPSATTLNATAATVVYASNGSPYAGACTFSGNNIIVSLVAADQSNASIILKTSNIQSPPYSAILVSSVTQNINNAIALVSYSKGSISNCSLSFVGITDQAQSNASLKFKSTNPVNTNKTVFRMYYGALTTGNYPLTNINITGGNTVMCSFTWNGVTNITQAKIYELNPYFDCEFPNFNLIANSQVELQLLNIRNPPYQKNYFSEGFFVETRDASNPYDISTQCSLSDVSIDTYQAAFTQTSNPINSVYSNPIVETLQNLTKRFQVYDILVIDYNNLEFASLGSMVTFDRPNANENSVRFDLIRNTSSLITCNNTQYAPNQKLAKVRITLNSFMLKMPSSASPVRILFRFLKYSGGLPLEFLNIFATVNALPINFDSSDMTISPLSNAIGDQSNYVFQVRISQPLSTNAYFLIYFPFEASLAQFTNLSVCSITSLSLVQPPTCAIADSINKIVQINVNTTNGIAAPQTLTITLGDIINPDSPVPVYKFGVDTYFKQGDAFSKVQLGSGIFTHTYTMRFMDVAVMPDSYTVNQFPSVLTLVYNPKVRLPIGIVINFNFTTYLTSVAYRSMLVNGTSRVNTVSVLGQQFDMTLSSELPAASNVTFIFQFKAPPNVSTFNAVVMEAKTSSGVVYERTANVLSITVANAASEGFSISPASSVAGANTTYTINFFTNVYHPDFFYLRVSFPSDVSILASSMSCSSPCNNPVKDLSTGAGQVILLNITRSSTTNTYAISFSSVSNPRKVGPTGMFTFATYTTSSMSSMVLTGTTSLTVNYPNAAYPSFDASKPYHKSNTEPVSIISSFTNHLQSADYIQVRFDYRSYGVAQGSTLKCTDVANYLCIYDSVQSTQFTTVIRVTPLLASSRVEPVNFSIEGLISSSTTLPTQQFEVVLRTYSQDGRQMDEGKFMYLIGCTSPAALLAKNCKTCNQATLACTGCYTPGFYLFGSTCVTDCSNSSEFRSFATNNTCVSCSNNCRTCISLTECLSCVSGFYLYEDSTCNPGCPPNIGLYVATINGQLMCLKCFSPSCLTCSSGGSASCSDCGTSRKEVVGTGLEGRCVDSCGANTYTINNQCLPCDASCNECTSGTSNDCRACRPGYFNISGSCVLGCPSFTVALTDTTCGCSPMCGKCSGLSTNCITCSNPSLLLYNYQCISQCYEGSYNQSGKCVDCNTGCRNCTATLCLLCQTGYSVYENKCYTECNTVGERFASVNGTCIECPVGCDFCDASLRCSICLVNYTLVNDSVCQKTCELQNNCEKVNPVPEKIIPLPGMIASVAWLLILVVLKVFVLKGIYLPYSYIFGACLAEFVIMLVTLSKMNIVIQSLLAALQSNSRLLQAVTTTTVSAPKIYQYGVLGILATTVALNYVANFVYLLIFCKYLRKYIPDRQIDKISNYLVIVLGTLSNYKFSLMAYSKLFPKPNILVENQSKLTPLHYMCIASIFTSILPLSAAAILVYNEIPLTDLFMLGVDLLIIELISLVFTIWMVAVDKPAEYFEGTKKYAKEEVNFTMEGLQNERDSALNQSKNKIMMQSNIQNSIIQVEDAGDEYSNANQFTYKNVKSDNENEPLPRIPIRASNIQVTKITAKISNDQGLTSSDKDADLNQQNFGDKKTLRTSKNRSEAFGQKYNNKSPNADKVANEHQEKGHEHNQPERGIKSKIKEAPKNFSKEKKIQKAGKATQDMHIKMNETKMEKQKHSLNDESEYMEDSFEVKQLSGVNKARSDIIQREKKVMKPQTQRSSVILPVTMKKKESVGMFESEKASSQIDEIDFESLIQSKMIDKTKDKNKPAGKKQQSQQYEQISPSWFNEQNQRFDFEESSDN